MELYFTMMNLKVRFDRNVAIEERMYKNSKFNNTRSNVNYCHVGENKSIV